jgi:hypothetical protein
VTPDAGRHAAERPRSVVWVDVVQPAGRQEALHNADVPGAQFGPAEQPVLSAHWDDAQGALKVICVD